MERKRKSKTQGYKRQTRSKGNRSHLHTYTINNKFPTLFTIYKAKERTKERTAKATARNKRKAISEKY